ncbi:C-type lectin domain family 2 member D-like [Hemicordylus capensis]|uniref:C-type lectin domain family 2 member D-like n=1 Tax=Hemicordylus capensis TaxID=884348 RepID=UPI002303A083|nr:C-type lectin domain family 2 member D-like [Hemicordylus capensis]XP_053151924.1 C-type lectin domain family 2 member D-like [Hemicordylus capensis]XP_053151925.1 C-type lectin domain family 2 member D-like [Hemicordylus capensis]
MECKNLEKNGMISPHNTEILENGLWKTTVEQEKPFCNGHFGTIKPYLSSPKIQLGKTQVVGAAISFILLAMLVLVLIGVIIVQDAKIKSFQALCPQGWLENEMMCYYFSDAENDWNASQNYCISYGGLLAAVDTQQERDFVKGKKSSAEYWINLRREKVAQPWKWSNGTVVRNWFQIRSEGLCAYLNEDAASSTFCENLRHWICSKPVHPN